MAYIFRLEPNLESSANKSIDIVPTIANTRTGAVIALELPVGGKMILKAVFPGQYLQGPGLVKELPRLVETFGSKALLLASKSVIANIIPGIAPEIRGKGILVEQFGGECSQNELKRVEQIIRSQGIDVMIGMGGGKVIDTAKITADWADIPVIVLPTIASTDAPCSGCAVTYSPEGIFESVLFQKRNPAAVIVDLDIITNSPVRFLVSGMGDALATWFEARSCDRSKSLNECGGHSTLAGLGIARICYETLLKDGYLAKLANEANLITPAFSHIVETNILLSGIGFESCGIASAHAIHNGLTSLSETHGFYHGEKVAFGVLAGLHLTSADSSEIEEVYSFCEQIGLPTCLAEIGIHNTSPDYLRIVASQSCLPGSSIFKEAGEIDEEMVLHAILMADSYGRKRKNQERPVHASFID